MLTKQAIRMNRTKGKTIVFWASTFFDFLAGSLPPNKNKKSRVVVEICNTKIRNVARVGVEICNTKIRIPGASAS